MKQVFRMTTLSVLAATLVIAAGCSHDSALDPIGQNQTDATYADVPSPAITTVTTFVETFDNFSNEGQWSWGTPHGPTFVEVGGNPGWHLRDSNVQSFAPNPHTALGVQSVFTGDYKTRNVISVGIDLRSFWYYNDISSRYLTLFLMNDNHTPYDITDDWGAYIIGDVKVPSKYVPMKAVTTTTTLNEPGWISYDFAIDAQSVGLPKGWKSWRNFTVERGNKPGGNWSDLMEDVSYVRFYYGDPTTYYLIDDYILGMDNPRISWQ